MSESKSKLVKREYLAGFYSELIKLYLECTQIEMREKIKILKLYYENYIIEKDKEDINELKRIVYKKMKQAKDKNEYEIQYEIYQKLKSF